MTPNRSAAHATAADTGSHHRDGIRPLWGAGACSVNTMFGSALRARDVLLDAGCNCLHEVDHARTPAGCDIVIEFDDAELVARELEITLTSRPAGKGSRVTVETEGADADRALASILALIAGRFGEDE